MMKITDEEFDLGVEMERQCAAEQLPGAAKAWATEQDSAKAEGRDAGIRLLTSLEDSNYEHLDDVSYALAMAHTCSGDLEAAQAMCAVFCGSAQATQREQTYMGEFAGRWRRSASKGKHSSTPGHTDRTDGTDHTTQPHRSHRPQRPHQPNRSPAKPAEPTAINEATSH
eukprot:CAMPEP_0119468246 /NCGR_PEP_ID=MMETSP1344-20130328/2084_1 /TAXON_ID=236787 /ORGANISM="Florenciella parvula, Strain CCMP2471" /LENGTH=168 /DNA_ID=CAMNT_0007500695 /DNA_START=144 /DNA_END=651 /DNA_ORIENTATION=-